MAAMTTIGCRGCGASITAKRNGKTTIWLEANGRKHACPNAGNFAQGEVIEAERAAIDMELVFDELKKLDEEQERAKLAQAHTQAAPKVRFVNGMVPPLDKGYIIDTYHLKVIRAVIADADDGEPQNMAFYGPAGTGKTTLAVQIGALRHSPTWLIDSTSLQTADEWFGSQTIKDGTLTTTVAEFVTALQTPRAVVILDDVALLQNRTVQSGLNGVLDPSRRSIVIPGMGINVQVAEGVIIIGTWNVGDEYVAERISAQIVDRFRSGAMFELQALDDGAMERMIIDRTGVSKVAAKALVAAQGWLAADKADPIIVTSRGLEAAARKIIRGLTYGEAVSATLFSEYDANDRAKAFMRISTKCPPADKAAWTDPQRGQSMVKLA